MSASIPHSRNCSATTKRKSAFVITIGRANSSGSDMRPTTCWNVDVCPTKGTNCLGMLSRETGHSRVPAPPHMITGIICTGMALVRGTLQATAAQNVKPRRRGYFLDSGDPKSIARSVNGACRAYEVSLCWKETALGQRYVDGSL